MITSVKIKDNTKTPFEYAKPFLKRVIEYGNGEKKSRIR